MKKLLDGELHLWVEHLGLIQKHSLSGLLAADFSFLEAGIIRLIKEARKSGASWVWSYDDIYKEDDETEWQLPSVDIAGHFGLEGHGELKNFFKKKKIDLCCDWDTERSAWYPRFEHIEDAQRCVDTINDLFDELYLK